MFSQLANARRKNCNLDFSRTDVSFVTLVVGNDLLLSFFSNHRGYFSRNTDEAQPFTGFDPAACHYASRRVEIPSRRTTNCDWAQLRGVDKELSGQVTLITATNAQ